jgi:hypothetical protein
MIQATRPCLVCEDPERIPDQGLVCDTDRDDLQNRLDELPDLESRVDIRPAAGANERVGGSREAPVPIAIDALDLVMPARSGDVIPAYVPAMEARAAELHHRYVRHRPRLVGPRLARATPPGRAAARRQRPGAGPLARRPPRLGMPRLPGHRPVRRLGPRAVRHPALRRPRETGQAGTLVDALQMRQAGPRPHRGQRVPDPLFVLQPAYDRGRIRALGGPGRRP